MSIEDVLTFIAGSGLGLVTGYVGGRWQERRRMRDQREDVIDSLIAQASIVLSALHESRTLYDRTAAAASVKSYFLMAESVIDEAPLEGIRGVLEGTNYLPVECRTRWLTFTKDAKSLRLKHEFLKGRLTLGTIPVTQAEGYRRQLDTVSGALAGALRSSKPSASSKTRGHIDRLEEQHLGAVRH